jgi:Tol biopolymer transport system component
MSNWRASRAALVLAFSAILLLLPGSSAQAAFPAKNGRIAFVRSSGPRQLLWTMEADGSSQKLLYPRRSSAPAWSPHGTRIAFDNWISVPGAIMVADADGSNVRTLAHGGRSGDFRDPKWSPTGRQIVFTGFANGPGDYRGKAYRVLILNSDDGRITFRGSAPLLPRERLAVERPTWSPRGDRIAVEIGPYHRGVGETNEVFTMTPEGEDLRQLTDNRVSEYDLDWSPDGSRLLYVRIRALEDRYARPSDIVVMGKNGQDVRVLTHTKRKELSASFSPNGRRIVFSKCCYGESGTPEIFVMRADGTHVVRLTHNEVYDSAPDWQPIPTDP